MVCSTAQLEQDGEEGSPTSAVAFQALCHAAWQPPSLVRWLLRGSSISGCLMLNIRSLGIFFYFCPGFLCQFPPVSKLEEGVRLGVSQPLHCANSPCQAINRAARSSDHPETHKRM